MYFEGELPPPLFHRAVSSLIRRYAGNDQNPLLRTSASWSRFVKPHVGFGLRSDNHGNSRENHYGNGHNNNQWMLLLPLADEKISLAMISKQLTPDFQAGVSATGTPYLTAPRHSIKVAVLNGFLMMTNQSSLPLLDPLQGKNVYQQPEFAAALAHLPYHRLGTLLIRANTGFQTQHFILNRIIHRFQEDFPVVAASWNMSRAKQIDMSFYGLPCKSLSGQPAGDSPLLYWLSRLHHPVALHGAAWIPANSAAYFSMQDLNLALQGILQSDSVLKQNPLLGMLKTFDSTFHVNLETDLLNLFTGETVLALGRPSPDTSAMEIPPLPLSGGNLSARVKPGSSMDLMKQPWMMVTLGTPEKKRILSKLNSLFMLTFLPIRLQSDQIQGMPVNTLILPGRDLHYSYGMLGDNPGMSFSTDILAFAETQAFENITLARKNPAFALANQPEFRLLTYRLPFLSYGQVYLHLEKLKQVLPSFQNIPAAQCFLTLHHVDRQGVQGHLRLAFR